MRQQKKRFFQVVQLIINCRYIYIKDKKLLRSQKTAEQKLRFPKPYLMEGSESDKKLRIDLKLRNDLKSGSGKLRKTGNRSMLQL